MSRSRTVVLAALSAMTLILSACSHPPPPPEPMPAPPPAPPPIVGPQAVSEQALLTLAADDTFAPGSWTLTRRGRAKLNDILPQLRDLHGAKIVIYGYTDNVPISPALQKRGVVDNLDLSSKRADAVVRYLRVRGVNPEIMSAKGRGETHPIAPNETREGRRQNRRIELVVEQPDGAPPPAPMPPPEMPPPGPPGSGPRPSPQ
jgi:outer membrane protein OmpA-like peptidoglycan-associated protein